MPFNDDTSKWTCPKCGKVIDTNWNSSLNFPTIHLLEHLVKP